MKFKKLVMGLIMVALVVGVAGLGYQEGRQIERQQILNTELRPLTTEEKVEDFNYLYNTILENYPFLEVNKRSNGVDWAAQYDTYLKQVKATHNDEDFYKVLEEVLADLHNGHTHMLDQEMVESMRAIYSHFKSYWQYINYETVDEPEVLRRYHIEEHPKVGDERQMAETEEEVIDNASVYDLVEGQIGCIQIPSMLSRWQTDKDQALINAYLEKVKDYKALVIDIRGNGGGDSTYWSDYLLPKMISKPYEIKEYSFYKNGKYVDKYIKAAYKLPLFIKKVKDLKTKDLPNLPKEVLSDFTYYEDYQVVIQPAADSIEFKGKLYLLVDKGVYSSSEALAMFAKESGCAILVGEKTGGDGIGSDPLLASLPHSGYVFRFSKELGTTGNGTCDEECKTLPDYEVKEAKQTGKIKSDQVLQKVLQLEGF